MSKPVILIVEDNAITLKMARVALETAGYAVLEAADGRTALELTKERAPDLILQDLMLPDMNGFDLARRLRGQPGGGEIPLLACSGFIPKIEEAQASASGFTDFLVKPVEPSRLVQTVQAYLEAPEPAQRRSAARQRVLICDDDPVQLKLLRIRLDHMGFTVTAAGDGLEALNLLKALPPDAVVSDILMPGLDGFRLCLAVRKDLGLARLPVILASSTYIEEADRRLARGVGATAFVLRTPSFQEVISALTESLRAVPEPPRPALEGLVEAEYPHRVIRQLERQAATNANLTQRCAVLSTELSILAGISEAVMRSARGEEMFKESLAYCTDAAGVSVGALYLFEADGSLRLAATAGAPEAAESLGLLLKQEGFLKAVDQGEPVAMALDDPAAGWEPALLKAIGATSVLLLPLTPRDGDRLGVVLLASSARDLREREWRSFGQTVAGQIRLGIALNKTFLQVAASEQRYRALFESSVDGIAIVDAETRAFRRVNPAMCRMLGYAEKELRSLRVDDVHPKDALPGVLAGFEAAARGEQTKVSSVPFLRKDGTVILVDISGNTLTIDGRACVMGVFRDATERNLLESQLRQAQKMEAVGRLAGGVAHDFNNLLTAILGLSELSIKELPESHPVRKDLEEVKETARRAAQLTQQLLAFSRKQIVRPQPLDLNALIADGSKMLRRIIGEDIELEIVPGPDLWTVKADAGQIEQVIVNLCVNSRDAMPKGGRLAITTANVSIDEAAARASPGMAAGQYALISVVDDGTGMTEETKAHLFEPFFTTKERGRGTGLGLATCYGIVKQGGGYIAMETEPGRGTTFKIYLPRVKAAAEPIAKPSGLTEVPRGSETILLVEDESSVRNLAARILRKQGYAVLEAGDGREALEALSGDSRKKIRLVLTDVVMPNLGGKAVANELRSRRPDVKIIFTSGYTDEAIVHQGVLDPGINFLGKPFTLESLVRKVRDALDSK